MSATARLLRIFYRTGAPALPVLRPQKNTKPLEWQLEAWLLRSHLDAFASDLERIYSASEEIDKELFSRHLTEKEIQAIQSCETLPALNQKAEEIARLEATEILHFLKKTQKLSFKLSSIEEENIPVQTLSKDPLSAKSVSKNTSSQTNQKYRFGQLVLGSLPYPLFAADLEGKTLFFNRLFEKNILTKAPLAKSIRKAESFFRCLCIELLAEASSSGEGLRKEFEYYEQSLDLELRMCNIESGGELCGYLFVFENPAYSTESSAWRRRLRREHKYEELLDDFESRLIADGLSRNRYNISHTAEDLGIKRSTLQSKIKRLKIETRFPPPKGQIQRRTKKLTKRASVAPSVKSKKKATTRKKTKPVLSKKKPTKKKAQANKKKEKG